MKSTIPALLVSTALIAPFSVQAQQSTLETACTDLQAIIVADLPESAGDRDRLIQVVEAGDGAACFAEYERMTAVQSTGDTGATVADTAETTLTLEDEVTIRGRVLLDQAPARVDIEESAAEVEIEPGAPSVTVAQQAGEIIVRQAPANVTIDMPAPTIRIEQAAPEIIITMPDPSVTVGAAQPQVRVVQAAPRVSVTQAPPAVNLELERVEAGQEGGFEVTDSRTGQAYQSGAAPEAVTTEDAEINVNSAEPQVTMTEATEEAQVQIERADPAVRFEQAEPVVNVTGGEPQVEFIQSGEPVVTFEQAGAAGEDDAEAQPLVADTDPVTEGTDAAAPDVAATPTEAPAAEATAAEAEAEPVETDLAETDTAADAVETTTPVLSNGPAVERDGYNLVQTGEYEVETLTGSNLYGVSDEDIGEIGNLVIGTDGQIAAVIVEIGGFLGLGERRVEIPFDRLSVLRSNDGDIRAYIEVTQEELEAMPRAE